MFNISNDYDGFELGAYALLYRNIAIQIQLQKFCIL